MHSMSGLPNVYMLSSRVPDEADPVLGVQRAFFEHFATSRWEEHLLLRSFVVLADTTLGS